MLKSDQKNPLEIRKCGSPQILKKKCTSENLIPVCGKCFQGHEALHLFLFHFHIKKCIPTFPDQYGNPVCVETEKVGEKLGRDIAWRPWLTP